MSSFLKFFAFIIVLAISSANPLETYKDSSVIERFRGWVDQFKIQVRDDHHLVHLFENWLSNDKFILETNSKNLTYTLGHNPFSGMNTEEFSEFMGFKGNQELLSEGSGFLRGSIPTVYQGDIMDLSALPSSIDWRSKGMVNPIQDQKACGSCYSFSATASLESAVGIKTGNLPKLSEQQIVSCSGLKYGNLKCNGGMYERSWDFVKDNGGLCSEASYPYTSGNGDGGSCVTGCNPVSGTKVSSYVTVTPQSDTALMTALTVGPISISLSASSRSFQLYKSGIYNDFEGCGNAIDHAVVTVGYNTDNSQDYYIVRNSWGTQWGNVGTANAGYIFIAKGEKYAPNGMCGLLTEPMYPIV